MRLAGIEIEGSVIIELARRLRLEGAGESADKIETALIRGARQVELEVIDCEAMLRALEGCPVELTDLRTALVEEHVSRPLGLTERSPAAGPAAQAV